MYPDSTLGGLQKPAAETTGGTAAASKGAEGYPLFALSLSLEHCLYAFGNPNEDVACKVRGHCCGPMPLLCIVVTYFPALVST